MHHCTQRKWVQQVCCLPVSSFFVSFSRSSRFADLNDRIYTKLSAETVQTLAKDRRESGGRVDVHSITAEQVLEQANKVFAPYKISFAAPLSWFAVWKSESFSPFSLLLSKLSPKLQRQQNDIPSIRESRSLLLLSRSPSPPRRRRSVSGPLSYAERPPLTECSHQPCA